jgi:hypothetical protein
MTSEIHRQERVPEMKEIAPLSRDGAEARERYEASVRGPIPGQGQGAVGPGIGQQGMRTEGQDGTVSPEERGMRAARLSQPGDDRGFRFE